MDIESFVASTEIITISVTKLWFELSSKPLIEVELNRKALKTIYLVSKNNF